MLALAGSLFAQAPPNKTLVVNGKIVEAGVRQIDGHSYVDVETLAELTNGSVVIGPTRVVLKIPASNRAPATTVAVTPVPAAPVAAAPVTVAVAVPADNADAAGSNSGTTSATPSTATATNAAPANTPAAAAPVATAPAAAPAAAVPPPTGLSRGFATAAIAVVADMREWRGATSAMITHGLALGDAWAQSYHDQAQADLAIAEVAARTDADHNALGLLQSEAANLTSWSNGVLAARQDLNGAATIDPDALKNDTALAKIRSCSQFLNSMLVSGDFADDASCH